MQNAAENLVVDDFAMRSAAANLSKVRTFRLQNKAFFFQGYRPIISQSRSQTFPTVSRLNVRGNQ